MTEPTPIDLPVGLRWVKLVCRLGRLVTDSTADADAHPDLLPVGGTLTLAASPSRVRIQEADGRWRSVEVAGRTYTIRADGELVDNEGRVGVYIPDPASLLVEPQGYAVTAVVKPTGGTDWRVTVGGDTVLPDVVDLVAVSSVGSASPSVTASFDARLYALETGGGVDVGQAVEDYLTANPPAGGLDTEAAQDVVGAMIVGAGGTYDDNAGTITLPGGGGGLGDTVTVGPVSPVSGWWIDTTAAPATTTTTTTSATTTTTTTTGGTTTTTTTTGGTTTTTTTEAGGGSLSFVPLLNKFNDGSFATYTFNNLDFGAAEATRTMVIAVGTRGSNSVQSVTVDGVTATLDAASHASTEEGAWIYHAAVPTGGTATHTIEVDFGPEPLTTRCMIQVYRATGGTLAVADTAAGDGNSPSLTVTNPAGGHVLAASTNYGATAATCSWAGATQYTTTVADGTIYLSTAHTATAGDVTPTPTWTLASGVAHSVAVAYTLA